MRAGGLASSAACMPPTPHLGTDVTNTAPGRAIMCAQAAQDGWAIAVSPAPAAFRTAHRRCHGTLAHNTATAGPATHRQPTSFIDIMPLSAFMMRKSHARARIMPPANAWPLTAATVTRGKVMRR